MSKVSRRTLAYYAVDQLAGGESAKKVAEKLVAIIHEQAMADQVDFLLADIAWEFETRGQISVARVTTAHPLSKELRNALMTQIEKATKVSEVLLDENIDKSVIGGIRIETASRVWDGTTARKLTDLREAF